MNGSYTFKVDASVLRAKSQQVHDRALSVLRDFDAINERVARMTAYWQGDGSEACRVAFQDMAPKAEELFNMLGQHSRNLHEMASNYMGVESALKTETSSLPKAIT